MKSSSIDSINGSWKEVVARYQDPDLRRSLWQIANTFAGYIVLWGLMIWSLRISYWLTLALAFPAAGFMVRMFIIFHDCGHGSFFKSRKANDFVGFITGVITFTPYYHWRYQHALHQATNNNLDRRGVGDVKMLTLREYQALPSLGKLGYRILRHPFFMFFIGPPLLFIFLQRYPSRPGGKREQMSVWWTDLALVGVILTMSLLFGFWKYWLVQLPISIIATNSGVWLFFIQHQFENVYWERQEKWDFVKAALNGASFYKLPAVLNWFTGNIGFHHIHHLNPHIANYWLSKCYRENPIFQQVRPLTILRSLKSLGYRLWDEEAHRLVGFNALKLYRDQA